MEWLLLIPIGVWWYCILAPQMEEEEEEKCPYKLEADVDYLIDCPERREK